MVSERPDSRLLVVAESTPGTTGAARRRAQRFARTVHYETAINGDAPASVVFATIDPAEPWSDTMSAVGRWAIHGPVRRPFPVDR